ncbi:hypothetical protein QWJ26_40635, partial [Streptomyces sp. CSDS2]|uniref:hypothetical protein n=1 Tax=Streptomyces sp. CSDS2 TaxID=3055051 RepID=UPI0025B03BBC
MLVLRRVPVLGEREQEPVRRRVQVPGAQARGLVPLRVPVWALLRALWPVPALPPGQQPRAPVMRVALHGHLVGLER